MFSEKESTLLYRMKDNPIGFPFTLSDEELDEVLSAVKRERGNREAQTRRLIRVWVASNFNWFFSMDGGFKAERSNPPYPGNFLQDDPSPFGRAYMALESLIYAMIESGKSFKHIGGIINKVMENSTEVKNKFYMTVEQP